MGGAMGNGEKAKNFKGTMKTLLKYLKPFTICNNISCNICYWKCSL